MWWMYFRRSWGSAFVCFFFFSSRRRHTRFDCDWSSDVCSSDLLESPLLGHLACREAERGLTGDRSSLFQLHDMRDGRGEAIPIASFFFELPAAERSEERRVGKGCGYRVSSRRSNEYRRVLLCDE